MSPLALIHDAWLAWLISWLLASRWSGRTIRRPGVGRELLYRVLTTGGAFLVAIGSNDRASDVRLWRFDGGAGWLFAALAVAGFALTWWARLHLGRFWSSSVTRKAGHQIVESGPYGLVRHPIYSGLLLSLAATICVRATAVTILGGALMTAGIYVKARLEERFLRGELGADAYDAYARRVPMLLPFTGGRR